MSAGFEDSVLLTHKGVGHGVFGHPSLCTGHAIRAYFANGTRPEVGTVCEPEVWAWDLPVMVVLLGGPGSGGLGFGLPEVGMQRRSMPGEMREGDVRLWRAMRGLGRHRAVMVKEEFGGAGVRMGL